MYHYIQIVVGFFLCVLWGTQIPESNSKSFETMLLLLLLSSNILFGWALLMFWSFCCGGLKCASCGVFQVYPILSAGQSGGRKRVATIPFHWRTTRHWKPVSPGISFSHVFICHWEILFKLRYKKKSIVFWMCNYNFLWLGHTHIGCIQQAPVLSPRERGQISVTHCCFTLMGPLKAMWYQQLVSNSSPWCQPWWLGFLPSSHAGS